MGGWSPQKGKEGGKGSGVGSGDGSGGGSGGVPGGLPGEFPGGGSGRVRKQNPPANFVCTSDIQRGAIYDGLPIARTTPFAMSNGALSRHKCFFTSSRQKI